MRGGSEGWQRVESTFEDEFADAMGLRRLRGEWLVGTQRRTFRPPFDVYETDQRIVVKVEIAGMHEEDFVVSLEGRMLTVRGSRRDLAGKLAYQRMEINYGEFRVDIRLPYVVAEAEVEASYERGFLSVSVPRKPQPRRISISEADAEENLSAG